MRIFDLDNSGTPCSIDGQGIQIFDLDCDKKIEVFLPGPSGSNRIIKTGLVTGSSFLGSPKKASIIFASPFQDSNYSIALSGTDSRNYTYESKTASGFTINSNASAVITGEVSWTTTVVGETQ